MPADIHLRFFFVEHRTVGVEKSCQMRRVRVVLFLELADEFGCMKGGNKERLAGTVKSRLHSIKYFARQWKA